jgi:carbamoyltransferase
MRSPIISTFRPDLEVPAGGGILDVVASARPRTATGQLTLGISGVRRNATVAACENGVLTACCEQERLTRIRGVRLEPGTLPAEAVDAVLRLTGRQVSEISQYAIAEETAVLPNGLPTTPFEHHHAHAASAFYTSPFEKAAVLVCDQHATPLSVWVAAGAQLIRRPWPVSAIGFASVYSACVDAFGFASGQEHRLEALARLDDGLEAGKFEAVLGSADGALCVGPGWLRFVSEWLSTPNGHDMVRHRARVASAFQRHLGHMLLQTVREVRASAGMAHLCLAGGLFYNTYFTTLIRRAGIFDDVFVAPNPGNAGLAAGAALAASGRKDGARGHAVSPFLGPHYDLEKIKATLDNCKLSYEYVGEGDVIDATVDALQRGQLVGWFQGRMEWAHRALGNRSILASPLSPYVLDNLNVFLKQRERHRAYGLSVPKADLPRLFAGPPVSTFMEYEYEILDRERFRYVLPDGATRLRVQSVPEDDETARRYLLLHKAFGDATGIPALVNTSFNGFSEPIVCSPRDAIRVFFGTGLDVLVLDRFIIRK